MFMVLIVYIILLVLTKEHIFIKTRWFTVAVMNGMCSLCEKKALKSLTYIEISILLFFRKM